MIGDGPQPPSAPPGPQPPSAPPGAMYGRRHTCFVCGFPYTRTAESGGYRTCHNTELLAVFSHGEVRNRGEG